jgi:hypothetical protein
MYLMRRGNTSESQLSYSEVRIERVMERKRVCCRGEAMWRIMWLGVVAGRREACCISLQYER